MPNIVLIRHGQSKWNLENKFTGWKDIGLSENGVKEAIEAGKLIKKHEMIFDVAFSSVLQRAIKTMSIILKENNLQIARECNTCLS